MIRRRYVDVAAGQLHVTEAGPADGPPVVLLPWFPLSARMYLDELPAFAARGFRALAIDPFGQGRSSARSPGWSAGDHADAIAAALTALGTAPAIMVGGHMGATIAIELASRRDNGIRALALDGAPLLPAASVAAIRARVQDVGSDPLDPAALAARAAATLAVFDPAFRLDATTLPRLHRFIADYLEAGCPRSADMPADYPAAERLAALDLPVLVLTAGTDPLRDAYAPTLAVLRRGTGHVFAGGHPLHDPARAGIYAQTIVDILGATS